MRMTQTLSKGVGGFGSMRRDDMCAGVDGPGGSEEVRETYSKTCFRCKQLIWNCKCHKHRGGLKKRVNKNRKLTKPLRKKRPTKGV